MTEKEKPAHRSMQMDSLRAVATVAVVALHAAGPFLYRFGTIAADEWWWANLIDSAVRFSVPVFLMLTGALLLPRTESTGVFLKRRFSRLLGPFIFWSLLYLSVALLFQPSGSTISSLDLAMHRLRSGTSFHLWYVYMLIGIYLFIPILQRWVAMASRRDLEYFIALWLLALLASNHLPASSFPDFNLMYFSGYIGYLVLGHYLQRYFFIDPEKTSSDTNFLQTNNTGGQNHPGSDAIVKRRKWTIFVAATMVGTGILITAIGTAWISKERGHFDQSFYEYLSFNVILMATGAFLLAGTLSTLPRWIEKPVHLLSRYSYGIYLSHVMVLKLAAALQWDSMLMKLFDNTVRVHEMGSNSATLHPSIGIPIVTVVTVIIALFISIILNKLPFGKYISG